MASLHFFSLFSSSLQSGRQSTFKKTILISGNKIHGGESAGSSRLMNYARALAAGGHTIYLCSAACSRRFLSDPAIETEPNIFTKGQQSRARQIKKLRVLAKPFLNILFVLKCVVFSLSLSGKVVFLLYPSPEISLDLSAWLFLRLLLRRNLYYEANEVRRINREKLVVENRTGAMEIAIAHYYDLKSSLAERLTRNYTGLIAISTNIKKHFETYNARITVIPILVNAPENPPQRYPHLNVGANFQICFAGMISLYKEGFDTFYKAISISRATVPNVELHLYGPISAAEKQLLLLELPRSLGLDGRVFYHGRLAQDRVLQELKKYHLLVLPRNDNLQTRHGLSTKLAEYMISGVPALVTRVSDNGLFINDNVNGFIVDAGDPDRMARKLLYIMQNYNSVAAQVGENAYYTALEKFDYRVYSTQLSEFLA
jgi:glycosyltransferase involved in cell wall biosynthesis